MSFEVQVLVHMSFEVQVLVHMSFEVQVLVHMSFEVQVFVHMSFEVQVLVHMSFEVQVLLRMTFEAWGKWCRDTLLLRVCSRFIAKSFHKQFDSNRVSCHFNTTAKENFFC